MEIMETTSRIIRFSIVGCAFALLMIAVSLYTAHDKPKDPPRQVALQPAPVQATPALSAYDCHGIAIEAASAYGLVQREIKNYGPIGPSDKAERDRIWSNMQAFDAAAKKHAREYMAHPECTEDTGDMHKILK